MATVPDLSGNAFNIDPHIPSNKPLLDGDNVWSGQFTNALGTITASAPATFSQTWNNAAVAFGGLQVAITDTASAAGALPFQVLGGAAGTTNLFSVDKSGNGVYAGNITIPSSGLVAYGARSRIASPADGQITLFNATQTGFTRLNFGGTTSGFPALSSVGTTLIAQLADGSGVTGLRAGLIGFGASGGPILTSDGTDILAQRNGTNAQSFRVYNTYTDASNYERGVFDWSTTANSLTIGTAAAGTGSTRALNISIGGSTRQTYGSTSTTSFNNLIFSVDNSLDIGASGANRPRTGYFGTSVIVAAGTTITTNGVSTGATTAIPAGGNTALSFRASSTANFGVFFGSGAPTLSAAQGSLYLRSDGTTTNDRMYVNTDGGTTWTAVSTVA